MAKNRKPAGASKATSPVVCIVGLGYVGLPLALGFAKTCKVVGFDVDTKKLDRIARSKEGKLPNLMLTFDPKQIGKADYNIICVPTPVTKAKDPDLEPVVSASRTVGKYMKKGATVILESTVYPGVSEEVMMPVLEQESGMKCGKDFKIGYSPERVNPGDEAHSIDKMTKVVSGMDEETADNVADLYSKVAAKVFRAKDIKTAEAAKVIENIQRDLNIALMNELSIIFAKMDINIKDVLDASETKWNFHRYSPGMVGGHCIPVDPYYLVMKAEELGYHPQVILAGRAINDHMPKYVSEMAIKGLNNVGKVIKGSRVLIMGLTYKENVPDTRETPATEMIAELKEYGVEVVGCDPVLDDGEREFGIKVLRSMKEASKVDCVILAVAHDDFKEVSLSDLKKLMNSRPVLIDVRGLYSRTEAEKKGFYYRTL